VEIIAVLDFGSESINITSFNAIIGVQFPAGTRDFLFTHAQTGSGPIQPIQWVLLAFAMDLKRPRV
jgi:hypothetical protein